jgi:hypothetical protein
MVGSAAALEQSPEGHGIRSGFCVARSDKQSATDLSPSLVAPPPMSDESAGGAVWDQHGAPFPAASTASSRTRIQSSHRGLVQSFWITRQYSGCAASHRLSSATDRSCVDPAGLGPSPLRFGTAVPHLPRQHRELDRECRGMYCLASRLALASPRMPSHRDRKPRCSIARG